MESVKLKKKKERGEKKGEKGVKQRMPTNSLKEIRMNHNH